MAWRWWLQALASWLPRRWRPLLGIDRGRLLLQAHAGGIALGLQQGNELRQLAELPLPADAEDLPGLLARSLRADAAELPRWWLLPAVHGLRRVLEMPAAVLPHLRDAVGFEIERQTPFPAEAVLYDARVLGPSARAEHVRVELAVVPRERVAPLLANLADVAGVDLADSDGSPLGLNLLPPAQRLRPRDRLRFWHWLLAALALLLGIAGMAQLLDNRRQAADRLEQQVGLLAERARNASVQRAQLVGLIEGQAFLDASRQARAPSILIIEELSRRLPDGTSLERLALEGDRLSMTGQSTQAASLVAQLEGSPLWRSPALSGALQVDARSRRDRFTLIAELVPPTTPTGTPAADAAAASEPAGQEQTAQEQTAQEQAHDR